MDSLPARLPQAALFFLFSSAAALSCAVAATFEQNGIRIDFSARPVDVHQERLMSESDARFHFAIKDASGAPVPGAYPAAWLQRRAESQPTDFKACKQMIKTFIEGSFVTRPSLNLNVYYVWVLNDDSSISVVDPLFHVGGSNLLTMIPLSSPGYDWQYSGINQRVLVTLPESHGLAVIDSVANTVKQEVDLRVKPANIALQPDQHYAWVAYQDENSGGVVAVELASGRVAARLQTGRGDHRFAFSPDNHYVFVTNQDDGTLTVIDVHPLAIVRTIGTGKQPVSIDYSSAADAIYISHAGDGTLVGVDAKSFEIRSRTPVAPGLRQIRFAPGGRLAALLNPANNRIYVFDAAQQKITKSGEVEKGPDQLSFSDTLLYIRHRESPTVLMIPLDVISGSDTQIQAAEFSGGQNPFGPSDSPATGIVQVPGENAVLVAHPVDRQVYYYKEGMAAPMGGFRNFERSARAILAIDRSLREVSPGEYETTGRLGEAGTYDLAFFLESPRVIHCLEVRVTQNLNQATKSTSLIVDLLSGQHIRSGKPSVVRFKLRASDSSPLLSGLTPIEALTVLSPGLWQKRQMIEEEGDGIYRFEWTPPTNGAYFVLLDANWKARGFEPPRQLMLFIEE